MSSQFLYLLLISVSILYTFTFYVTKQNDSKSLTQILTFILN